MPTVLVTDANRGSAIAIMRSLARSGWTVVAADDSKESLGFHSRYVHQRYTYPSPQISAPAYVKAMRQAAQNYGVDLIIPVTDDTLLPLAASRAEFKDLCRLAIASDRALKLVTDKCLTVRLAERLGVPTPETHMVHTAEEARELAHLLRWPVVLKARRSRRFDPTSPSSGRPASPSSSPGAVRATAGAGYADNVEELLAEMSRFGNSYSVLIQPYYHGEGQGVEMLAYAGRPLAVFQHRRLAEVPITGGASALRESMPLDSQLYEYSRRLVKALQWTGLIMVEFKVENERVTLMEVNGRVWGSLPLAVHSGMDFPARLGDLYRYGPPPPEQPPASDYRVGLQVCNVDLMALWLGQVLRGQRRYEFVPQPQRRAAFKQLLGFLHPGRRYDVQTLRDPVPGLLQLFQVAGKLSRKVRSSGKERSASFA